MLHGVDDEQRGACVGVGQVASKALSHHMQGTGLIEVAEHHQVLRSVQSAGVSLQETHTGLS